MPADNAGKDDGTDECDGHNGGNGSGGQQKLLVGLLQVDDVATIVLLLVDVLFHGLLTVAGPDVGGSGQHLGNIILLKMYSLKYL